MTTPITTRAHVAVRQAPERHKGLEYFDLNTVGGDVGFVEYLLEGIRLRGGNDDPVVRIAAVEVREVEGAKSSRCPRREKFGKFCQCIHDAGHDGPHTFRP
jgi:hypothetical protein